MQSEAKNGISRELNQVSLRYKITLCGLEKKKKGRLKLTLIQPLAQIPEREDSSFPTEVVALMSVGALFNGEGRWLVLRVFVEPLGVTLRLECEEESSVLGCLFSFLRQFLSLKLY